MRHILFLLVSLISVLSLQAQNISKEQAVSDIDSLIYTISEVHPNMFSVCNQGEFIKEVELIKKSLPDSLSALSLFLELQPLIVKIGDGHTSLYPPYDKVSSLLIPLAFNILPDNKITVRFSLNDTIPCGSQILEINGITSNSLIDRVLSFESGESIAFRKQKLAMDFDFFFKILYGANSYSIQHLYRNKTYHVELPPCPRSELIAWKRQQSTNEDEPYRFRILPKQNVAIMDFSRFEDCERMPIQCLLN